MTVKENVWGFGAAPACMTLTICMAALSFRILRSFLKIVDRDAKNGHPCRVVSQNWNLLDPKRRMLIK